MMLPEPTTLHHGLEIATPATSSSVLAWFAVLAPVLIAAAWFVMNRRRQMKRYPQEHAFHALARRMGLRSSQVRAVRLYAKEVAQVAPITVLMNAEMQQAALARV